MSDDNTDERVKRYGKLWSRFTFSEYGNPVFEDEDKADLDPEDVPVAEYGDEVEDKNVARVDTRMTRKINIGDYNSVEASFGVSLPCHVSELEEGFEAARDLIEGRIRRFVDEVLGEREREWNEAEESDDDGDNGAINW